MTSWRYLAVLVGVGACWRWLVASMTVIPSEDGVNYLWMAEQFAAGRVDLALSEVFSPLLPMLIAMPISIGMDSFLAGQLVNCLLGALAVIPIVKASEALFAGSGRCAGCLVVLAPLPVRYAAEVYSEPLFILLAGFGFWAATRQRWWLLGCLAGLAYWVKPEAILLPLTFLLCKPKQAWRAMLPMLVAVALLSLWRGSHGHGYGLMAKLPFIWDRTLAVEPDLGALVMRFGRQLLSLPWLFVEAFGLVALFAAYAVLFRRRVEAKPMLWLGLMVFLLLACFLPRRRFLVSWIFAVAPLAALGLAVVPRPWHGRLLALIVLMSAALGLRVTDQNRQAEMEVGRYLQQQLRQGETVGGDMSRVLYYAGQRPPAPKRYTAQELIQQGRQSRFLVLLDNAARREKTAQVRAALPRYRPLELPLAFRALAKERRILVLESPTQLPMRK